MPDESEGEGPTTTTAELQRWRDLLDSLVEHPSRASAYVDSVAELLDTELTRCHTAVDAYVGKDAQSHEIRETCAEILADVAEDSPEQAAHAVPTLARALTTADSSATREDTAKALMRIAEAEPTAIEPRVETLRSGLEDDAWEVRHHTAAALGEVPASTIELDGIVGTFEQLLDDHNWLVRARAARALWRLAEEDAEAVESTLPSLFERLSDEEPRVRKRAGSAVAAVAASEPEAVAMRLDEIAGTDPDPAARAGAIRSLHGVVVRRPAATALLTDTVLTAFDDEDERVRSAAVEVSETLARAYPDRRDELVDKLLDVLDDPDWTVPAEAADTLAVSAKAVPDRVDEIVEGLLCTLRHESAPARHWCRKALTTLITEVPSTVEAVESGLFETMLHTEWEITTSAALTLETIASETDADMRVGDHLVTVLRTDSEWRRDAAEGLAAIAISDPRILEGSWTSLKTFLIDGNFGPEELLETRKLVAAVLLLGLEVDAFDSSTPTISSAVETLTRDGWDVGTTVSLVTMRALAKPTTQHRAHDLVKLVEILGNGLTASDAQVRARAATGLLETVERAPERVAQYLDELLILADDDSGDCRTAALDALGALTVAHPRVAPTCIEALGAALGDPEWQVRSTAVVRLGELATIAPGPTREQLPSVIKLFLESDVDVSYKAAKTSVAILETGAVGMIAPESAVVLRQALANSRQSDFVQTVAVELLARAGGRAGTSNREV
ncbi:HEAT repeat domain-containing protein [Haloarcula sp. AONF1]